MKKYFLYELKKRAFAISCFTLIAVAIYVTTVLTSRYLLRSSSETYVWIISSVGGVLAALVPAWLLSYKMKRRSVDLYYSLPLSHVKILTVRYLIGLIAVFAPYTVAYWLGAFAAMARAFGRMEAVWYLPQYFASLIPVYCIYAISSFVFTRANNIVDGLVFIAFWAFAVAIVAYVLDRFSFNRLPMRYDDDYGLIYGTVYYVLPQHYFPFAPLDFVTTHFQKHIAGYLNIHTNGYSAIEAANIATGFTITALTAAGASVGLFLTERTTKAENVGQTSESWFGYKTMIPLFTVCLIAIGDSFVLAAIVIAGAFLVTVAYKRTFKIGKIQALVLILCAIAGSVLFAVISYAL